MKSRQTSTLTVTRSHPSLALSRDGFAVTRERACQTVNMCRQCPLHKANCDSRDACRHLRTALSRAVLTEEPSSGSAS